MFINIIVLLCIYLVIFGLLFEADINTLKFMAIAGWIVICGLWCIYTIKEFNKKK